MKTITLMIPCYNEEKTISKVIKKVPIKGLKKIGLNTDILVMDNNSNDNTAQIAKKAGARVVFEKKPGKGNNLKKGFKSLLPSTEIVVMIDGDDTYNSSELIKLIKPILNKKADIVMGSRLKGKIQKNAMPKINYIGNYLFTSIAKLLYDKNVTDLETGFVAWNRKAADNISKYIEQEKFGIEPELLAKAKHLKYKIYSVPISYKKDERKSNLHPLKDGSRILTTLIQYYFWKPYANSEAK